MKKVSGMTTDGRGYLIREEYSRFILERNEEGKREIEKKEMKKKKKEEKRESHSSPSLTIH